jgi:transposase
MRLEGRPNMEKAALEFLLGQGMSAERIGKRFGKDPSTVSYWMEKYGLVSPYRERHSSKGGIAREVLERLVGEGLTITQIAAAVGLSRGTVRHWMRIYGLRTARARGERVTLARNAKEAGLLRVSMNCRHHGETEFILEGRGYYRCARCRSEAVVRHRKKLKATLVREAGGRCIICGYEGFVGALEFHHLDPQAKRLALSGHGVTYSLERLRAEARKCVLLCANCHAEVENGMTRLPLQ